MDTTKRKLNQSGGSSMNRSGQTLIMALIIMFLLAFIGGIFITIVARNMSPCSQKRSDIERGVSC